MKMLNIAWRTLRVALLDKKNLLMMFLMPLAFSLVFGLLLSPSGNGGGDKLPLALYVADNHPITTILVDRLQANPNLVIRDMATEAALQTEVQGSQVVAGLLVPAGFGEQVRAGRVPIAKLLREVDTNLFVIVEQELQSLFTQFASAGVTANQLQDVPGADPWQDIFVRALAAWDDPVLGVESTPIGSKEPSIKGGTHIGIGFTIMFVMMAISMAAGCVLEEREWGTWSRILAAPVEKGQLMAGYVLGYFGLGWFQLGILMLLQKLIFGTEFGGGWGMVALASSLILCAVSLGMLMAVTVKTFQQQQAVAAIVLNITSMLGGLFFPIEMFSPALMKIAMLTPQFWARQGFVDLVLRGSSSWSVLQKPLLILTAYSVVFFLIGWQRLRTSE